ncbi:hypothetical protein [Geoalkalibacter sp.]|nr:hypothetical protein [Geoalkalibacter sp.]
MKRLTTYLVTLALLVGLSGCAAMTPSGTDAKVKCPACGYEFEVPKVHN